MPIYFTIWRRRGNTNRFITTRHIHIFRTYRHSHNPRRDAILVHKGLVIGIGCLKLLNSFCNSGVHACWTHREKKAGTEKRSRRFVIRASLKYRTPAIRHIHPYLHATVDGAFWACRFAPEVEKKSPVSALRSSATGSGPERFFIDSKRGTAATEMAITKCLRCSPPRPRFSKFAATPQRRPDPYGEIHFDVGITLVSQPQHGTTLYIQRLTYGRRRPHAPRPEVRSMDRYFMFGLSFRTAFGVVWLTNYLPFIMRVA